MLKLHQVVALVAGKKTRAEKELGELNKLAQKPDLFNGLNRTYQPIEEGGEALPAEEKRTVASVSDLIQQFRTTMTDIMDAVATQEKANTDAVSEIAVDGHVLLTGVPVTTLLFIEHQLDNLRTFVGNLPTLDPAEQWKLDENSGQYVTQPTLTHRTKKLAKPIVLYPATPEHPAQTQLVAEDVLAGHWQSVKSSTAIAQTVKRELLSRITKLIEAVRIAREGANSIEAEDQHIANPILDFIFGKSAA